MILFLRLPKGGDQEENLTFFANIPPVKFPKIITSHYIPVENKHFLMLITVRKSEKVGYYVSTQHMPDIFPLTLLHI